MNHQMQQLADRYEEVLQQRMGLDVQVADDKIHFQTGSTHFLIPLYQGDPEYLRLVLPGFFSTDDGVARGELERICGETTRKCKAAQLTVGDNGVVIASVEMIVAAPDCLPTTEHLMAVLPRAILMLLCAVREFFVSIELHGIAKTSSE
ncbi:hypothetical protein ACWGI8_10965 [Streptomyces sp. NPDC054841]